MKSLRIPMLLASLAGCFVALTDVAAERPAQSKEQLLKSATQALTGTVVRTYERHEPKDERGYEWTYGVAEIKVARVIKGNDIKTGDRVFVRYWEKKWVGGGSPPPDANGNWDIPVVTDTIEVFVEGDRQTGYDVLNPNGFFQVTKAKSADAKSKR